MKIDFDNVKDSKAKTPTKDSLNDDETAKILRQKDHDIASLRRAIQQEQEIVAHVQLTQEKEIIEKEREIAVLNAILSQERQIILDRETEIGKLLAQNGGPKVKHFFRQFSCLMAVKVSWRRNVIVKRWYAAGTKKLHGA